MNLSSARPAASHPAVDKKKHDTKAPRSLLAVPWYVKTTVERFFVRKPPVKLTFKTQKQSEFRN